MDIDEWFAGTVYVAVYEVNSVCNRGTDGKRVPRRFGGVRVGYEHSALGEFINSEHRGH